MKKEKLNKKRWLNCLSKLKIISELMKTVEKKMKFWKLTKLKKLMIKKKQVRTKSLVLWQKNLPYKMWLMMDMYRLIKNMDILYMMRRKRKSCLTKFSTTIRTINTLKMMQRMLEKFQIFMMKINQLKNKSLDMCMIIQPLKI